MHFTPSYSFAAAANYKKVKAVRAAMYEEGVVTRACYKLLNASGETGCEGKCVLTATIT